MCLRRIPHLPRARLLEGEGLSVASVAGVFHDWLEQAG